jgi:hypothetical protein
MLHPAKRIAPSVSPPSEESSMKRVALIAIAAVTLVVAGCGNARTSKTALTAGGNAICVRTVVPVKRKAPVNSSPSLAAIEAQRAALAGCTCIVCTAARGRIDTARLIPRSLVGSTDDINGRLNVLPHLAPVSRAQLGHAAGQVGPMGTMPPTTGPSGSPGLAAPLTSSPPLVVLP